MGDPDPDEISQEAAIEELMRDYRLSRGAAEAKLFAAKRSGNVRLYARFGNSDKAIRVVTVPAQIRELVAAGGPSLALVGALTFRGETLSRSDLGWQMRQIGEPGCSPKPKRNRRDKPSKEATVRAFPDQKYPDGITAGLTDKEIAREVSKPAGVSISARTVRRARTS